MNARAHSAATAALSVPRAGLVAATLRAKRREHPALRGAPTLEALHAACDGEGIQVRYEELPSAYFGCAFDLLGTAFVMMDRTLPTPLQRLVLAHEIAHHWLGHCRSVLIRDWRREETLAGGASRPIFDRCEAEADLLGAQLLGLPVAAFRAAIESAASALESVA
ncbi:MAG: ImmA/IrrE family metallo-endopeptidase [Gemmatimonadota bacterium]|nr:ImmA/IrrE family metallo-endopeptidase [Gemmatimonadota bacterium]